MPDPRDGDESADASPDRSADSTAAPSAEPTPVAESEADPAEGDPAEDTTDNEAPSSTVEAERDRSSGDAESRSERDGAHDRQSAVAAVGDPDIEDVLDEERRLHGRVRILWIVRRVVPALIVGGLVGFVAVRFDFVNEVSAGVGVGAGAFALVMAYGVARALLLYRSWRYVVREDSLYLTRGVFTVVQTIVPYVRVQHIDTRRSAFERALGLASLVVYTAGSRGADVTIPGLTPERAETLQSRLKRLAIESEDEDAV